jgi:hypothetical protein
MSSIQIHDLAHAQRLDRHAMASVRGGVLGAPNVNVNVTLNQQIAQFQDIGVNVLNNNGVIGAGFKGPDIDVAAALFAENNAVF